MACLSLSLFLTRLAVYMYMYVAKLCCNLGNGCDCLGLCSFHLTVHSCSLYWKLRRAFRWCSHLPQLLTVASELWGQGGTLYPQVQDLYPLYSPSQRCGLCQNFKQTTLTTRLYKVRTNLYPSLTKTFRRAWLQRWHECGNGRKSICAADNGIKPCVNRKTIRPFH